MILNVLFALLKAYITHLDSAGIYNHRAAFRTDPDRLSFASSYILEETAMILPP